MLTHHKINPPEVYNLMILACCQSGLCKHIFSSLLSVSAHIFLVYIFIALFLKTGSLRTKANFELWIFLPLLPKG